MYFLTVRPHILLDDWAILKRLRTASQLGMFLGYLNSLSIWALKQAGSVQLPQAYLRPKAK